MCWVDGFEDEEVFLRQKITLARVGGPDRVQCVCPTVNNSNEFLWSVSAYEEPRLYQICVRCPRQEGSKSRSYRVRMTNVVAR